MYFEALSRSFDAKRVSEIRSVAAARDLIGGCRLPCHRFVGGDDFLARAKGHSLLARVADAKAIASLPPSMRLTEMVHLVTRRRSTVTAVNAALTEAGIARHPARRQPPQLARPSGGAPPRRLARSAAKTSRRLGARTILGRLQARGW